ncbi:MAG: aldo/keto reductase [Aliishimia sp.]
MTQLTTRSGAAVRPFSFGTMQFGGKADEAAAAAMFDLCCAAGITHFDTAYLYTDGRSEEILAPLIKANRDDLYVATKVGYAGGAGRANMRKQFDVSRKRLQSDQIDLLYLHRFDPDTELRETMDTFATLKSQGLIRHIGLSNFAAWQVMKAQRIAAEFGVRVNVLQPMYSLVKRQAEVEILPMCADQGIAACTYSPLGGGLLSGKYNAGDTGRLTEDDRYAARYAQAAMTTAANGLSELAQGLGAHPATLAIAWIAAQEHRPQPILSAKNTDQLTPSLKALTFEMTSELYREISALMPAPPPATDRLEEA